MGMDILNDKDWQRLMEARSDTSLSLLMPTHRFGPETQQDPIRLKNLLSRAEEELEGRGMDEEAIKALLAPAWKLHDDHEFWQHQSCGLALYLSHGASGEADTFESFRVPLDLEETVVIDDRYYLKPLLPLRFARGQHFVLALSQNQVRLYAASRDEIRPLTVPEMPESLDSFLGEDQEPNLQHHTADSPRRRDRDAVFHGHGDNHDEHLEADLRKFFHQVAEAIADHVTVMNAPLVLATVDSNVHLYREAHKGGLNKGLILLEETIPGNPEHEPEQDLRKKAWDVVEPWYKTERTKAWESYNELYGSDRASHDLQAVLTAAYHGRVDTLFLARGGDVRGTYDPETATVTIASRNGDAGQGRVDGQLDHGNRRDLLNAAAIETLKAGGKVYVLPEEQETESPAVAVLRY